MLVDVSKTPNLADLIKTSSATKTTSKLEKTSLLLIELPTGLKKEHFLQNKFRSRKEINKKAELCKY